ncbi:MAG: DUF1292 domain-containing protein [Acholeplasmataceae bacterium]
MLENNQILVTTEDGKEMVCEILFTHEVDNKNYVVFEFPDSGEISAAVYLATETEDEGYFEDVESEEEWEMLDKLLEEYFDEIEAEDEEEDNSLA